LFFSALNFATALLLPLKSSSLQLQTGKSSRTFEPDMRVATKLPSKLIEGACEGSKSCTTIVPLNLFLWPELTWLTAVLVDSTQPIEGKRLSEYSGSYGSPAILQSFARVTSAA
jgi:hypothetical protein